MTPDLDLIKQAEQGPGGSAARRVTAPRPELAGMIKEKAKAKELGIPRKSFRAEEILRRLLFASVNEACKILEGARPIALATLM